jgi:hypothetical protein
MSGSPFFYLSTCHPVARRTVLRSAVAAAGAWMLALPRPVEPARQDLTTPIILAHARRRVDPWAIVHGVRAMGRDFAVEGGGPAVSFVLSTYLEERDVNGSRYLAFPRKVERHENQFLKTFLEAGVPLEFAFTHKGRQRTLGEVVDGARALFRFSERTDRDTIAWSLIALTRTTPPARGVWTNAWGERVELARVVQAGFETMEGASRPIQEARDKGVPLEERAPVHAFTCGGTHLLYSLLVATDAGYRVPRHRDRIARLLDLLAYRLQADLELLDRFYGPKLSTVPGTGWYLLDARIKFVGHAFECLGYAERHGLHAIAARDAHRYDGAAAALDRGLAQLLQLDMNPVRAAHPELYRQLVGDVCHAHRGLGLVTRGVD